METHKRSVAKTITWRVVATLVTILVVYLFTREVPLSIGAGIGDMAVKIFAYYGHERLWDKISFGRKVESWTK